MSTAARLLAILAFALAMLVGLGGCNDKLTAENYAKIKEGMTVSQVEAAIGKGERQDVGGMSISGAGVAGGSGQNSQTTYTWRKGNKEVTVIFENGKVVTHTASGL